MKIKLLLLAIIIPIGMRAANSTTTRTTRITSAVTVSANTDYVLTLTSNLFSSSGSINIPSNAMEHSVIIFRNIKPSVVISNWLSYVKINGSAASDGVNCQVRMYNKGAIVLPYGSGFSPLTCYTGTNYSGTACSDYSVGHSGGYMKTLTEANLQNNFKSFKLKRGYMVTFATGTAGWGYSRCFIAATEDLEMNLPAVLAGKVSSYRLFQWYNFGKSGIANETRAAVCDALNVQGCYTYNVGGNMTPDVEWLPHKIHKWWPGVAECGNTEYACTMKTDNEPANGNDDTPASVDEVLGYWEDAMRTGMRLCSPSTYDNYNTDPNSSHYNRSEWFDEFFEKIDARGWRCDLYDIHCYWTSFNGSGWFNIQNQYNYYKRPLIISEWMYGSSWGNNGCFASDATDNKNVTGTSNMLSTANTAAYVERYFYWNSESKGKIYDNGLTTLGQTYAAIDGGLGYNASYEYTPKVVINNPYSLVGYLEGDSIIFSWKDKNGDMMDEIRIQYKENGASSWNTLTTVAKQDKVNNSDQSYSFTFSFSNPEDYIWRISDAFDGSEFASNEIEVSSTTGKFYIYNNESGLFISAGANWGTRSIGDETGIDFLLRKSNGKYTLDSNISNGGNNQYLGSNLFCDSGSFEWTLTKAGTIDGKQAYTISDGTNHLLSPTTAGEVINTTTNGNSNLAKWVLLTKTDLMQRMENATEDNPVDATFLLPCAGFGRNDKRIERWNGSPARGGYAGGEWGNQNAEKFNTTFDVYQLVTDAPDGLYEVTCQAFYRYGGHGISPAATAKANGTEALNAKFYANDVVADVLSIFADADNCGTVGVESDYGYAPNTMDDASNYFQAGLYQNGPLRFVVEGGSLRVGIKKDVAVTNDWTIFDNFRLSYLGPDYIIGDVNNDKQITIADVTALVNIILGKDSVEPYLYNHKAADVNTDKGISIADVTALVNIILGKIGS